jgi:hypothetical protein
MSIFVIAWFIVKVIAACGLLALCADFVFGALRFLLFAFLKPVPRGY